MNDSGTSYCQRGIHPIASVRGREGEVDVRRENGGNSTQTRLAFILYENGTALMVTTAVAAP